MDPVPVRCVLSSVKIIVAFVGVMNEYFNQDARNKLCQNLRFRVTVN